MYWQELTLENNMSSFVSQSDDRRKKTLVRCTQWRVSRRDVAFCWPSNTTAQCCSMSL